MIKIMLNGCNGKMGRVITDCVANRDDCEIVVGIDKDTRKLDEYKVYGNVCDSYEEVDVIIDFSHPSALNDLIQFAKKRKIPVVFATTGYSSEEVQMIEQSSEYIPVFFTYNMSLGVNLLVDLAKKATDVLGTQFDIEIIEKHHNQKIDAPSGTALMIADALNETLDNKYKYTYDRHSKRQKRTKNEIGIHAVRGGTIVGEHEVIFAGRDEILSISHSAMSKDIFAVGAVNACVFMANKQAGLYNMGNLV